MSPEDRLIARLLGVYGEPKTPDPEMFIAEFGKAIEGWSIRVLDKVGDQLIRDCQFWPKPAEVIEKAKAIAADMDRDGRAPRYRFPSKMGPYDEKTLETWRKAKIWRDSIPDDYWDRKTVRAPVPHPNRKAFTDLQAKSPNTHLHGGSLTEASKRMSGDHE